MEFRFQPDQNFKEITLKHNIDIYEKDMKGTGAAVVTHLEDYWRFSLHDFEPSFLTSSSGLRPPDAVNI